MKENSMVKRIGVLCVVVVLLVSAMPIVFSSASVRAEEGSSVENYIVWGTLVDKFGVPVDTAIVVAVNMNSGNSTWVYGENGTYTLDLGDINGTLIFGNTIKLIAGNGICISNYTFVLAESNPLRVDFVLDPPEENNPSNIMGNPDNLFNPNDVNFTSLEIAMPEYKSDLIITEMSFSDDRPVQKDIVTLTATVTATGLFVESFDVAFYIDVKDNEHYIASKIVTPSPLEVSSEVFVIWNTNGVVGYHNIIAVVDVENKIDEMNETNNEISKEICVLTVEFLINESISQINDLKNEIDSLLSKPSDANKINHHLDHAIDWLDETLESYNENDIEETIKDLHHATDEIWKAVEETNKLWDKNKLIEDDAKGLINNIGDITFLITETTYVVIHTDTAKDITNVENLIIEIRIGFLFEKTSHDLDKIDNKLANALQHYQEALDALAEDKDYSQEIEHGYDKLLKAKEDVQDLIEEGKMPEEFGERIIQTINGGIIIFPPELKLSLYDISISGDMIKGEANSITVKIHNDGVVKTENINVDVYDNDILITSLTIPSISAKSDTSKTMEWTPTTVGTHYIKVVIDTDNKVVEKVKEDNVARHGVYVIGGTQWWDTPEECTITASESPVIVENEPVVVQYYPLTIENGGHLILRNTSLIIDSESEGGLSITVQNGGRFDVLDNNSASSIITALDQAFTYNFFTYGILNLTNSKVQWTYGDKSNLAKPGGIQLYSTSQCNITGSTIKEGETHNIYCDHASPRIINSIITFAKDAITTGYGIYCVNNSAPIIEGCLVDNSKHSGVFIDNVDPSGTPAYTAGSDLGYFIWADEDGWHIRWSGDSEGNDTYYNGTITALGGITSVSSVDFEADDTMTYNDTAIVFNATEDIYEDGIDFTVGSGDVVFDIQINSTYIANYVYIGVAKDHPLSIPFTVSTTIPQSTVKDNVIVNNTNRGLFTKNVIIEIRGNLIQNNTEGGIYCSYSNGTITQNMINETDKHWSLSTYGISCTHSSLTIKNNAIVHNPAPYQDNMTMSRGGWIAASYGTTKVENNNFLSINATYDTAYGGVSIDASTAVVSNNTFTGLKFIAIRCGKWKHPSSFTIINNTLMLEPQINYCSHGIVAYGRGVIANNSIMNLPSGYGISVGNSMSILIENNTVEGRGVTGSEGINCYGSIGTVRNNILRNVYLGVDATNSATNITNNNISYVTTGMWTNYGCTANVSNNTIRDASAIGISCCEGATPTIYENNITNSKWGIVASRSSPIIRNNNLTSNYRGIYCYEDYANITHNIITDSTGANIFAYGSRATEISFNLLRNGNFGIYTYASASVSIRDNNIIENRYDGIYASDSSLIITDNTITDNDQAGIYLRGWGLDSTIVGNTISSQEYGIYCRCVPFTTIKNNNKIVDNTFGIYCWHSSPSITNNIIESNTYGTIFMGTSNSTVAGNEIYSNDYGIWCDDPSPPEQTNSYLYRPYSPIIIENDIHGNDYGIRILKSSPIIWNNSINSNTMGIHCEEMTTEITYDRFSDGSSEKTFTFCYPGYDATSFTLPKNANVTDASFTIEGVYLDYENSIIPLTYDVNDIEVVETVEKIYLATSTNIVVLNLDGSFCINLTTMAEPTRISYCSGEIYTIEENMVRVYDLYGNYMRNLTNGLVVPVDIDVSESANRVYVSDMTNGLVILTPDGTLDVMTNLNIDIPSSVSVDDKVYLIDNNATPHIDVFSLSGDYETTMENVSSPKDVSVSDGKIYVAQLDNVAVLNLDGSIYKVLTADLKSPTRISSIPRYVYTMDGNNIVVFSYGYPHFPTLDIGDDGDIEWSYSGEFNSIITVDEGSAGLLSEIRTFIRESVSPEIVIPLRFSTSTHGMLKISNISITYTISPVIEHNTICSNVFGSFYNRSTPIIRSNEISDNNEYGICSRLSTCSIINNTIHANLDGILYDRSQGIIKGNSIQNHKHMRVKLKNIEPYQFPVYSLEGYGIYCINSPILLIEENNISKNMRGIYVEDSSGINIINNTIDDNRYAYIVEIPWPEPWPPRPPHWPPYWPWPPVYPYPGLEIYPPVEYNEGFMTVYPMDGFGWVKPIKIRPIKIVVKGGDGIIDVNSNATVDSNSMCKNYKSITSWMSNTTITNNSLIGWQGPVPLIYPFAYPHTGIHYEEAICWITNNTISGFGQYGIHAYSANTFTETYSRRTEIAYNSISENKIGIYCYNSSPTISYNNISTNNECGVYCTDCSNVTIANNKITSNLGDGISSQESYPMINNNTIKHNVGNGVYCGYSSGVIDNNKIYLNENDGIHCYYSSPTIMNNYIGNNTWGVHAQYVRPSFGTIDTNNYVINKEGNRWQEWYCRIQTLDWNATPLGQANVTVGNQDDGIVWQGKTDSEGYTPWITMTEYKMLSDENIIYHHNISAEKIVANWTVHGERRHTITKNMEISIQLYVSSSSYPCALTVQTVDQDNNILPYCNVSIEDELGTIVWSGVSDINGYTTEIWVLGPANYTIYANKTVDNVKLSSEEIHTISEDIVLQVHLYPSPAIRWALLVGPPDYRDPPSAFKNDVLQARDYLIHNGWTDEYIWLFTYMEDPGNETYIDGDATKSNVISALNIFESNADGNDIVYMVFSDHGGNSSGHSYFCTQGGSLWDYELGNELDDINCKNIVLLVGACYSGGFIDDCVGDGRIIGTAAPPDDYAYYWPGWHTFYLYWFHVGLTNITSDTDYSVSNHDGLIDIEEAHAYAVAHDYSDTPQFWDWDSENNLCIGGPMVDCGEGGAPATVVSL